MIRLGFRLNTKIAAPTQYALPFNSLAWDGEQVLGGGDGLYRIAGNLDAADTTGTLLAEPVPIYSKVQLPKTDFGIANYKRIRWLYFGYESVDDLRVTVAVSDTDYQEYTLPALVNTGDQWGQRIPIHRNLVGRYFTITIDNPNGCHFTLDSITGAITVLPRTPRSE